MLGIRSLFSTLYTDSFLASRQTESFSPLLLSLIFSFSLPFALSHSISLFLAEFSILFFSRDLTPSRVIFFQQLKLLPQPSPSVPCSPTTWRSTRRKQFFQHHPHLAHTMRALLLPLYETVFNHVISFIIIFFLYSFPRLFHLSFRPRSQQRISAIYIYLYIYICISINHILSSVPTVVYN